MAGPRAVRVAIFGGTFDPVHCGHLALARAALEQAGVRQVVFVVSGIPPHKARVQAGAEDRQRMVELAVRREPGMTTSRLEVDRHGPSHTHETVADLRRGYYPAGVGFLLGADSFAQMGGWAHGYHLLGLCPFIVGGRFGRGPWTRVRVVDAPLAWIHSTGVRERVRRGQAVTGLIPREVEAYVRERRLYA